LQLFQQLNREQGITIIFVTHEPDIAAYCKRVIYVRDGVVERDEAREPLVAGAPITE
jgi:putative ABC transport system ATP-binding protein